MKLAPGWAHIQVTLTLNKKLVKSRGGGALSRMGTLSWMGALSRVGALSRMGGLSQDYGTYIHA